MRRAITLLEVLVVASLFVVVFSLIYEFWWTATRYSDNLEARFTVLNRAQVAVTAVTRELSFARRALYPEPGGAEQPGVGFIAGTGEAVMVGFQPGAAGRPGSLYRHDFVTGQRRVLMQNVLNLQAKVAAPPPGLDAGLVHLALTLAGPGGKPIYLVTSARLRAVDVGCPMNR